MYVLIATPDSISLESQTTTVGNPVVVFFFIWRLPPTGKLSQGKNQESDHQKEGDDPPTMMPREPRSFRQTPHEQTRCNQKVVRQIKSTRSTSSDQPVCSQAPHSGKPAPSQERSATVEAGFRGHDWNAVSCLGAGQSRISHSDLDWVQPMPAYSSSSLGRTPSEHNRA